MANTIREKQFHSGLTVKTNSMREYMEQKEEQSILKQEEVLEEMLK